MTFDEFQSIPKLSELRASGMTGRANFGIKYRSSNESLPPMVFERSRIPNGVRTSIERVTFNNGAN